MTETNGLRQEKPLEGWVICGAWIGKEKGYVAGVRTLDPAYEYVTAVALHPHGVQRTRAVLPIEMSTTPTSITVPAFPCILVDELPESVQKELLLLVRRAEDIRRQCKTREAGIEPAIIVGGK